MNFLALLFSLRYTIFVPDRANAPSPHKDVKNLYPYSRNLYDFLAMHKQMPDTGFMWTKRWK